MMNNSDSEITKQNTDFGSVLAVARKSGNLSIEEVSEQLKIPAHTIVAIEANDIAALPAPTYTQGYIRTYAKFLEISEDKVLDLYNLAVPHDMATELKPRSNLPGEANSQSPLVKMVTVLLIVAGIAAVIYGSFKYYQEKANVMETELESKQRSFTGNSLDSPATNPLNVSQNASLSENDELIEERSDPFEPMDVTEESEMSESDVDESDLDEPVAASEMDELTESKAEITAEAVVNEIAPSSDQNQDLAKEDTLDDVQLDVLKIYARNGSWMQVRDASNARLLYTMVPVRGSKVLRGHAPFRISLGNAKTTSLVINDLAIDVSDYIRANNTATFTVSTEEQQVVFH